MVLGGGMYNVGKYFKEIRYIWNMSTKYLEICLTCDGGEDRQRELSASASERGIAIKSYGCLGRCPDSVFGGGSVNVVKITEGRENRVSYGNHPGPLGKREVLPIPNQLASLVNSE
jgi:hypothetical protein